jgi:hypothetical protein
MRAGIAVNVTGSDLRQLEAIISDRSQRLKRDVFQSIVDPQLTINRSSPISTQTPTHG